MYTLLGAKPAGVSQDTFSYTITESDAQSNVVGTSTGAVTIPF